MKLFTTLAAAAVSFTAAPVQALPIWATSFAQSHCEYLAIGATWSQALAQATYDNAHWRKEMTLADDNGLLARTIGVANLRTCAELEKEAYRKHKTVKTNQI